MNVTKDYLDAALAKLRADIVWSIGLMVLISLTVPPSL
jgi:hypothetical protein